MVTFASVSEFRPATEEKKVAPPKGAAKSRNS